MAGHVVPKTIARCWLVAGTGVPPRNADLCLDAAHNTVMLQGRNQEGERTRYGSALLNSSLHSLQPCTQLLLVLVLMYSDQPGIANAHDVTTFTHTSKTCSLTPQSQH